MKLTLARKRLLLGSSNVGIVVVLSLILLATNTLESVLSGHSIRSFSDLISLFLFFLTFSVIQSGFDLMGATACERDEVYPNLEVVFRSLLRGIVIHTAVIFLSAILIHIGANILGRFGAISLMLLIFYFLSKFKLEIAQLISPDLSIKQLGEGRREVVSAQPSFHGGIQNNEDISSNYLFSTLTSDEATVLRKRRELIIQHGNARLGEKYSFAVLLFGAFIGMFIFGINPKSVSGLCELSLWSSAWSFICLLILPTFDRRAVFAMDRTTLSEGVDKSVFESALRKQDLFFDDETVRTKLIEKIFHPIPMLEERILEIRNFDIDKTLNKEQGRIPWHILRQSLYLSWGSLSMISRSVHCSVGRPQCWVFLPVE